MTNRIAGAAAAAVLLTLVTACGQQPQVASQPTPQMTAQAAEDSAAAERLAQARADSISRAAEMARMAARSRADSVREQVVGETTPEPATRTSWGLAAADSMGVADKLHFNFDQADLSAEDLRKLEIKRQVLVAHPDLLIEIAGNADERGADEYNLALGLRRAAAAHRWLVAHGISEQRIHIVSYGEERPLNPGHDEAAWAQNRRADFLVTRPAR